MKTKGMEFFVKRIDDIFSQGMPTKAQIIDAYKKAVEKELKEKTNEKTNN